MQRCDTLALCTDEPGRVTRLFLSPAMRQAHATLTPWFQSAGLTVHTDALGNLIGRRHGPPESKRLLIGSHIDSVPNAGKYDGVLGVLIGLAVAEALEHEPLAIGLDILAFSEEEGVRFAKPYLGSRAIASTFDSAWLARTDEAGITLTQAIENFGLDPTQLPAAAYDSLEILGYIEPHIEQGPLLESRGEALGVVTSIIGQSRLRLSFRGRAAHAGTTPMDNRQDALVAAATFIAAVRRTASETPDLRATVGRVEVTPNAPNVVPALVELSLDVRHAEDEVREQAIINLLDEAYQLAQREGLAFTVLERSSQTSVKMDPALTTQLHAAASANGTPPLSMVSGAGHDAVILSERFPVAMLFLRHPGGVSHHPDETVEEADVATAIEVLTTFVRALVRKSERE